MKILLITVIEIVIVSVIRAAGSVINDNLIFALDIDLKILYLSSRCVNLQQRRVEIPPNASDVYHIFYLIVATCFGLIVKLSSQLFIP